MTMMSSLKSSSHLKAIHTHPLSMLSFLQILEMEQWWMYCCKGFSSVSVHLYCVSVVYHGDTLTASEFMTERTHLQNWLPPVMCAVKWKSWLFTCQTSGHWHKQQQKRNGTEKKNKSKQHKCRVCASSFDPASVQNANQQNSAMLYIHISCLL